MSFRYQKNIYEIIHFIYMFWNAVGIPFSSNEIYLHNIFINIDIILINVFVSSICLLSID